MKKYKVEMKQIETFCIDVLAESEQEATDKATAVFGDMENKGIEHLAGTGDGGFEIGTVYDVTNTDDPFDPFIF